MQHHSTQTRADHADTTPRAWIGSLAAYNAGRLVGAWIDLQDKTEEEVTEEAREAIRAQVAGWMSDREALEELHVFDHEHLSPLVRGECGIAEAVKAAEEIAQVDEDRREAFIAYAANVGQGASAEDFEAHYLGEWDSIEDYAEELVSEQGLLDKMPEELRGYFDMQAYARDLVTGGDIYTVRVGGTLYVFSG